MSFTTQRAVANYDVCLYELWHELADVWLKDTQDIKGADNTVQIGNTGRCAIKLSLQGLAHRRRCCFGQKGLALASNGQTSRATVRCDGQLRR